MADTKVSNLIPITVPSDSDILYIVKGSTGASNKITFINLLAGVNSNITSLNNNVDIFKSEVDFLSSYFTELNISNFLTDLAVISTNQIVLSADVDYLYTPALTAEQAITFLADLSAVNKTFLSGGLTTSIPTSGGTLNFINGVLQSVT